MPSKEALSVQLQPLVEALGSLDLNDAGVAAREVTRLFPPSGELVRTVRATAFKGLQQGWLLDREAGGVRFGRVAKDLSGFTIDAVHLHESSGPAHRHPNGEIDLLFEMDGAPMFDGHGPGWAVYPPGSEHVPVVRDGSMLILYFLPGGAIEWI